MAPRHDTGARIRLRLRPGAFASLARSSTAAGPVRRRVPTGLPQPALREPPMMIATPARQTATPTQSLVVGVIRSTAQSHRMATPM